MFPHINRIIAQPALENCLEDATIGEEYVWSLSEKKYIRSGNLLTANGNISAVPVRQSTIWTRFETPTVGNPENAVPRTPSGGSSVASGDKRASLTPPAVGPSKFLPVQDQAKVREWSRNVDTAADPGVAAEQPVEPEADTDQDITTRRVVEDSDSETEAQQESAPGNKRSVAVEPKGEDKILQDPVAIQKHQSISQPQTLTGQDPEERARQARLERANRYRHTAPAMHTGQLRQAATNVIAAGSFFAGVPRDEEQAPEAVVAQRTNNLTGDLNSQPPQRRPLEPKRTRGRGFGYDGAADDLEESDSCVGNNEVSKLTSISCQDPEPQPYVPSEDINSSKHDASRKHHPPRNLGMEPASSARFSGMPVDQSNTDHFSRRFPNQQAEFSNRPRPGIDHELGRRSHGDVEQAKPRKHTKRLVDVETNATEAGSIIPPPGLIICQAATAVAVDQSHILDSPLEEIQRPSLKPSWDAPTYPNEDTSFSALSQPGGSRQPPFDFTPQTELVKPNINLMSDDILAQLQATKQKQRKKNNRSSATVHTAERIEEEDEIDVRKFHNTMNLKAPNPGRGKNKSKSSARENGELRAERIAATKADAYGSVAKAQRNKATTAVPSHNITPPSERIQQLAKSNSTMSATHADVLQVNARKGLADDLVHRMRPMFEAARAYAGDLHFECQIGNLLVMPSSLIKEKRVYERDKWPKIFDSGSISPDVKFNNIVTCDGSEVDNVLEMKARGNKTTKVWNKDMPGATKMEFELQCQDNAGRAFKLRFNVDGTHSVDEGYSAIGKIGVHCPGRAWDMCAVLGGVSTWHYLSDDLDSAIAELVSGIYVSAKEATAIHFRIPASNILTVHDVILRRTSFHNCQSSEQEDVQLKITENKFLYTRSHRVDKRLYYSFEKSHKNMEENNRVHYEVSVIHKGIAEAFKANKQIEVGELTSVETTGALLLTTKAASTLLEVALNLVDRIDWVGKRNHGTIVRQREEDQAQEQEFTRMMPPATHTKIMRPISGNMGYSIAGSRTVDASRTIAGSRFQAPTPSVLPYGIRAGTTAQVYEDASGNRYMIGQGGAQIPVIREEEPDVGSADILPNDSASQIGRRPRGAESTARSDKPAGFW